MPHGVGIAKRKYSSRRLTIQSGLQTLRLAPKYEELAHLYTSHATFSSQVVVAKVDATANDVPDEIQGFPTIKLFPAGGKSEPILYSGSRTIEDLAKFVKENGKYGADAYEGKAENETVAEGDEELGKQAPAATEKGTGEKVKSKISEAAEAVKTAVADSDHDGVDHDEL